VSRTRSAPTSRPAAHRARPGVRAAIDRHAVAVGLALEGVLISVGSIVGFPTIARAANDLGLVVQGRLAPNVFQFAGIGGLLFLGSVTGGWMSAVLWQVGGRGSDAVGRAVAVLLRTALALNLCGAGMLLAGGFDRYATPGMVVAAIAGTALVLAFGAGLVRLIQRTRVTAARQTAV